MLGGDAGKFGTLSKAALFAARAFALKGAAVGRAIAVRQRRHRRSFFHRTAKCCRQQFFRIRVARFLCKMRTGQNLHDFTLIKNDHALAEMTHKRQSSMSREISNSSASAGQPNMPRRVLALPSLITPFAERDSTSQ